MKSISFKSKYLAVITLSYFFTIINLSCNAQCFSLGALNGSSFANDASNGSIAFSNPSFVQTPDANRATASALLTLLSGTTNYLEVTDFNANIPLNATVCGIEVEAQRSATGINLFTSVSDGEVRLIKNGSIVGNNKALPGKWPTTDTYGTYGSINDLWGNTLTPADVNASNFGVAISADIVGILALLPSARINYVRMTVYYSVVVLPAKLISFDITKLNEQKLQFKWQANNEQDVSKYEIDYADDAINWHSKYSVVAAHTEPSGNYNIELPADISYSNYYRLKIIFKNGSFEDSPIKTIKYNPGNSFQLITGENILSINNINTNARALIIDINGKQVLEKNVFRGNVNMIDISMLPSGIYVLNIENGFKKFIKK